MSAAPPHGAPAAPEEAHRPVFAGPARTRLEALFPKFPTKQACLLPALWIVQQERGWISPAAMAEVAEVLGVTPAYVRGVVTFYTMYHTHPVGRHFIQVCTTSPCHLCGHHPLEAAQAAGDEGRHAWRRRMTSATSACQSMRVWVTRNPMASLMASIGAFE